MVRITQQDRARIVGLVEGGASYNQVSTIMQVHRSSVVRLISKYRRTGSVADLARRPRGRVTTRHQDHQIVERHQRNQHAVASVTARGCVGNLGNPISSQTVRNRLLEAGLRCRRPLRGVVLTLRHRQQRLQWARRHLRRTRAERAAVLFTDESRFNLYDSDGRLRVYRRRNERFRHNCLVERNRQGGGSVMIWGGMSMNAKTRSVVIRGNLNALRYQNEILTPVCIPHLRNNRRMCLMHDGAPAHSARATRTLLQANKIIALPWPSCSPDLRWFAVLLDVLRNSQKI